MPSSRLDCPLSLKTPNMGNTGIYRKYRLSKKNDQRHISLRFTRREHYKEWLVFLVGDTLGRDDTLPS